jgi:hypothetical protein
MQLHYGVLLVCPDCAEGEGNIRNSQPVDQST